MEELEGRYVDFYLFQLIKDITETTKTKKYNKKTGKYDVTITTISRRHLGRRLSWVKFKSDTFSTEEANNKQVKGYK